MKYFLAMCAFILFSCNNNQNNTKTDTSISNPNGFEVKKFAGLFYDTLPCADCAGIATNLYLKPDNSFIMEQEYIGKGIVYDLGKWSVTDSILKLTGNEGPRQFKIVNYAAIKLLDNEGRMLSDSAVSRITFNRINTPFKPLQPIPVEGIFSAVEDTMTLLICATGNQYPVALAPDALTMKAAYKKAVSKKNEPLYAKLEGHFELRPDLKDTATRDFFVVARFVKFIPAQQCR